ncbi:MAG: GIN domain-containing protein [Bacteroidia bacterium]
MKTSIKNLIAAALTLVVLTSTTLIAKADDNAVTVLSNVKKVNKINVSGNVELILVQSADESVKVYDNYYTKNALVQQKDGELRVSSYEKETLVVVVYVSNLTSITASDNAVVKTHGKFSALDLDVNLNDNSKAILNTNTISLNTNVKGNATLGLTGTTLDYNAVLNSSSKVNMTTFVAENSNIRSQNTAKVAATSALSLLIAE